MYSRDNKREEQQQLLISQDLLDDLGTFLDAFPVRSPSSFASLQMPSRAPTPAAVSTAAKRSAYSSNIYNGSSPVNNGGYSEKEWLLNLLSGTRSDQTSSDGDIEANEISNGDNGVVTNGSSDIIIKQKSPRKSSESVRPSFKWLDVVCAPAIGIYKRMADRTMGEVGE